MKLSRLDLREIEDVIEDAKQVLTGALNLLQIIALLFCQHCIHHKVRHPDDGIHGSSYFMAHIGEEGRLHLRRLLGHFARFLNLRGSGAALGYVLDDPDRASFQV